jgi:hypothetical protein
MKMKVKVAAQQVAAAIETFIAEATHTAEFVSTIDSLFDSLNGSQLYPSNVPYSRTRCIYSFGLRSYPKQVIGK